MRLPDIHDLIQDLQLAKQIAIENRSTNALIMATISQAKLLRLDKQIKDVMPNSNIKSGLDYFYNREPESVLDYSMLTGNELRQLQTIIKNDAER